MRIRPVALALLLAFAPVAAALPARAQNAADDPMTDMARARFKEGVGFYDKAQYEQARVSFLQNAAGGVPSPFDCFLVLRGIKTLAVRMERHCANATRVALALADHPGVDEVQYPGLAGHPGHETAARQMRGFGGMVSFTVRGGEQRAMAVASNTSLFALAESLGAVESLIEHPHRMTHASVVGTDVAVDPALLRLSVGLEDPDDLVADLEGALESAGP